jgi:TatD DNase family protein
MLRKRDASGQRDLRWPEAPEPLPRPVYDNHTHMDFEDGTEVLEPSSSLRLANQVGVQNVIQVGTDVTTSRWGVELAEADHRVLAAIAIHPNTAPDLAENGTLESSLDQIRKLAEHPRVCAIGETGLDYFRTEDDGRPAQLASFEAHIEIAKQFNMAMQIHDRNAHSDVVETLVRVGAPERTVFHCFSGDAELARICNEHGWMMSFAGTVTFKNAPALREALAVADPSLILVETDAPFLTPDPLRGRPNASYLMPHTVRRMAEVRNMDLADMCDLIVSNTERTYGSWNGRE